MMEKLNLDVFTELGKFTVKLKNEVKMLVVENVKASTLINYVEKNIFQKGYLPAFPCTICINDVAAHYTVFDDDIEIKKGDVVKVDFGVSNDGYITDTAFTIEVGTNFYKKMLDANLKTLNQQLEKVDLGTKMFELGEIASKNADEIGCNTIHNLSGHQIEINNLHAGLHVPNYNNGDLGFVEENMVLAIEPYFSSNSINIKNGGLGNILELVNLRPVRDVVAKKILNHIKSNYRHLPFSKRWLVKDVAEKLGLENAGFSMRQVIYGINILKKYGIIHEHEMLVSSDGSVNSQFEETVVFIDGKKSIITR